MQTEYNENMKAPSPGTISSSDYDTRTGICETAAGIGFGLAVSQGTLSDKGVVIGGTLAKFRGISVKDITLGHRTDVDEYHQYDNVGYLSRGTIWVSPADAVAANDPVHFDGSTGRLTNAGGIGPIPGARWITSSGADGRAEVYLSGVAKNGIS